MAKPVITVVNAPSFYEDAAARVEHSLDECYADSDDQVHQYSSKYDLDDIEEIPWGLDPETAALLSGE